MTDREPIDRANPENHPSIEQLRSLDDKYDIVSFIGKGLHDAGYLVKTKDGTLAVALTPIGPQALNWISTMHKGDKMAQFDELGIRDHIVHEIEKGTLQINGPDSKPKPVVIFEYAGEMIETFKSDHDKLEALKQIKKVLDILHQNGYAVNDFKPEHWLARKVDGKVQVRLIDPTQIRKLSTEDSQKKISEKLQANDHAAFIPEIIALFSWVDETRSRNSGGRGEFKMNVEDLLNQVEEGIQNFSNRKKLTRKLWMGFKRMR